jgi:hypothetical protein
MAAGVYTLEVEQGSTKTIQIQYKDSEGAPIDITGYSGRGQIRRRASDADPLAAFEVTVSGPLTGVVDVVLPATALAGARLQGASYGDKTVAAYDIELYKTDDVDDVIRLLNGVCNISPEVTK